MKTTNTPNLLTYSRACSFKACRKRHWFEYEIGLRKAVSAKALRMGNAFHAGLEALHNTGDDDAAFEAARAAYVIPGLPSDPDAVYDLTIEQETVTTLLRGYSWRWQNESLKVLAVEMPFRIPLFSPATGEVSEDWMLAGKIDGIVELPDGRLAVREHKLLGEDVRLGSEYWRRMRLDHQVSIYIHAARQLGYDVTTALYDVARKPTIRPTPVPLTDDDGLKIVVDADGNRVMKKDGKPRQTAGKGMTAITRPMKVEEWQQRVITDIEESYESYYARVEIPRLDTEIDECLAEIWELQRIMRSAQRESLWFRTVGKDTCKYCSYFGLCSTGFDPSRSLVPGGFVYLSNVHPELEETTDESEF